MSLTTAAAKRYVQSLHTLGRQSCDSRGAEGHQNRGLGESTEGVERGAEGVTSELVLLGSPEVTGLLEREAKERAEAMPYHTAPYRV